jgi:hypothetical protein
VSLTQVIDLFKKKINKLQPTVTQNQVFGIGSNQSRIKNTVWELVLRKGTNRITEAVYK